MELDIAERVTVIILNHFVLDMRIVVVTRRKPIVHYVLIRETLGKMAVVSMSAIMAAAAIH